MKSEDGRNRKKRMAEKTCWEIMHEGMMETAPNGSYGSRLCSAEY